MISKSVLIMGFGLAKAKSQQAESHLLYPLCTQLTTNTYHICPFRLLEYSLNTEPDPLPGSKSTTKDPSRIILNVGSVILTLKNLKNIWKSVGGLGMSGEV